MLNFLKNINLKYSVFILSSFVFLMWMSFCDGDNIAQIIKNKRKLNKLKEQKFFYYNEINRIEEEKEQLMSSKELLEKFAREKYLMKKPNEDIYIIE